MDVLYVYMYSVLLFIFNMFFFYYQKTLLLNLISLEALMFMVIMLYIGPFTSLYCTLTYWISLMCLAAGGAACGLSMLITLSRYSGNDLIKCLYEKNKYGWSYY